MPWRYQRRSVPTANEHARRRHAVGYVELHASDEGEERHAHAPRVDAPASVEGEQRSARVEPSALRAPILQLLAQEAPDLGSERNEPGLAELAGSDGEQATIEVDVAALQAATFAGAEAEAVEQREERLVRHAPATGPSVIVEIGGHREQAPGEGGGEDERDAWVEDGATATREIAPPQPTLSDEPSHQPVNDGAQRVEVPRARATRYK